MSFFQTFRLRRKGPTPPPPPLLSMTGMGAGVASGNSFSWRTSQWLSFVEDHMLSLSKSSACLSHSCFRKVKLLYWERSITCKQPCHAPPKCPSSFVRFWGHSAELYCHQDEGFPSVSINIASCMCQKPFQLRS